MTNITNTNHKSIDKNTAFIDKQLHRLEPYFASTNDELPLLDIIITKASKPEQYLTSVAVFLPDGSLIAKSQNQSAEASLETAFSKIFRQIQRNRNSKKLQKHWWGNQVLDLQPDNQHL